MKKYLIMLFMIFILFFLIAYSPYNLNNEDESLTNDSKDGGLWEAIGGVEGYHKINSNSNSESNKNKESGSLWDAIGGAESIHNAYSGSNSGDRTDYHYLDKLEWKAGGWSYSELIDSGRYCSNDDSGICQFPGFYSTPGGQYFVVNQNSLDSRICDKNYSGACVPMIDGDIDCADVGIKNFHVVGKDIYYFDKDKNGICCEPWP